MKILIVRTFPNFLDTTKYNVQEIGLAKALVKAGHEVGIVLYHGKKKDTVINIPVSCQDETREIKVYYLHGWNLFKNGIFPTLHKIVSRYDVIQVHEYDQITSWLYYAWSKKKVVIYHGPYYDDFNKGYNLKCKIFDHTFLLFKHNRKVPCLTKSHAAAEFLRSKGFQNVTAVGVGLDIDNFTVIPAGEDRISVEKDTFTLLYVGKIEKRRNSMFLADLMTKITMLYKDIRCIVIGNGEKEYTATFLAKIEPLVKTGIVRYYSSATQSQLADLYKNSSLLLFPSSYEIFGMVLAEAIYFDLPIVSTKNGGADMLISDSRKGYIVPNLDMDEWIRGIEFYYCKGASWERDLSQINEDKSELHWEGISKKMIAVYRQK